MSRQLRPSPLWEWLFLAAILLLTLVGIAAVDIAVTPDWTWPL